MTKFYNFDSNGKLKEIDRNLVYLYERLVLTVTNDVVCIKNTTSNFQTLFGNSNVLRNPLVVSHTKCKAPDGRYYFYYYKNIGKFTHKVVEEKFSNLPNAGDMPFYSIFHGKLVGFGDNYDKDEVRIMDKSVVIRAFKVNNTFDKQDRLSIRNCYLFLLDNNEDSLIDVLYNTNTKQWVNKRENIFL